MYIYIYTCIYTHAYGPNIVPVKLLTQNMHSHRASGAWHTFKRPWEFDFEWFARLLLLQRGGKDQIALAVTTFIKQWDFGCCSTIEAMQPFAFMQATRSALTTLPRCDSQQADSPKP